MALQAVPDCLPLWARAFEQGTLTRNRTKWDGSERHPYLVNGRQFCGCLPDLAMAIATACVSSAKSPAVAAETRRVAAPDSMAGEAPATRTAGESSTIEMMIAIIPMMVISSTEEKGITVVWSVSAIIRFVAVGSHPHASAGIDTGTGAPRRAECCNRNE